MRWFACHIRVFSSCILALALLLVGGDVFAQIADPSPYNSDLHNIRTAVCEIWYITTQGVGLPLTIICIVFLGIQLFFGRITWGTAMLVFLGAAVVVGSLQIARSITGHAESTLSCVDEQGQIFGDEETEPTGSGPMVRPDDDENDGTMQRSTQNRFEGVCTRARMSLAVDYNEASNRGSASWQLSQNASRSHYRVTSNNGCSQNEVVAEGSLGDGQNSVNFALNRQCQEECLDYSVEVSLYNVNDELVCSDEVSAETTNCPIECDDTNNPLEVINSLNSEAIARLVRWRPHDSARSVQTKITTHFDCMPRINSVVVDRGRYEDRVEITEDKFSSCPQDCAQTQAHLVAFDARGDMICDIQKVSEKSCNNACSASTIALRSECGSRACGQTAWRLSWNNVAGAARAKLIYKVLDTRNGRVVQSSSVDLPAEREAYEVTVADVGGSESLKLEAEVQLVNQSGQAMCSATHSAESCYALCEQEPPSDPADTEMTRPGGSSSTMTRPTGSSNTMTRPTGSSGAMTRP